MGTQVPHQRRYVPGTMVLETTWHTPTGWLLVQDLLVIEPVTDGTRRPDYRRSPGDAAATGTLLRLATCIEGHVEVVANVVPVFEYGVQTGMWDYDGDGYETMTVKPPAGDPVVTVSSTLRLGAVGARCYGRSTLEKGSRPSPPCPGAAIRPPTSTRRRPSSPPRSPTGATGCPTAPSPTTPGAAIWSAAP